MYFKELGYMIMEAEKSKIYSGPVGDPGEVMV